MSTTVLPAGQWRVVTSESHARFSVRDKLVTTVRGSLPVVAGWARVSAAGKLEASSIELEVRGISTGNDRRDRQLHAPTFLDAATHPRVVVKAGAAALTGSDLALEATLSARGKTTPLDLVASPVEVTGSRLRAMVTGTLDRSGLGMRVPSFVVGRRLAIEVDVVFERESETEDEARP